MIGVIVVSVDTEVSLTVTVVAFVPGGAVVVVLVVEETLA